MDIGYTKVLLLTANVGSIFEEPDKMLPIWLKEFLSAISRLQPEFIAIHCQEVGGKNYAETMQHVNKFIKMLLASDEMLQFDRARVFLDEDFTAVEKFTALGSLYFIHRSVKVVEIFNFYDKKFVPVEGKEVLSGNIEHVHIKEKSKFPQEFFPDFVWSRKGFIRTRWNVNNTLFDLVNIHLFHDISNLAAMEKSPSTYSTHRERALMHTIERFETDEYDKVPFFIFGDFNFRMDTNRLVKKLTPSTTEERIKGKKNDVSSVLFRLEGDDNKVVLKIGKKDFHHCEHNEVFSCDNAMSLKMYDCEPISCQEKLFEYPVTFPPSYPFSEKMEEGSSYMPTRCPGWCDRIMMSHDALPLLLFNDDGETPEYAMIGRNICMGDHKPILLDLKILRNATPGLSDVPRGGHVSVCVEHDNDDRYDDGRGGDGSLQVNGDGYDCMAQRASSLKSQQNVISINGQTVFADDLNDINIHNNIKFEMADLVCKRPIPGSHDDGGHGSSSSCSRDGHKALDHRASPAGQRMIKPTLSFRNVVNNVLKSDSILRYMKRFKHRSDSESDDEDDDDEDGAAGGGGGDHHDDDGGVGGNRKQNRDEGEVAATSTVDSDDCENNNNNNNNNDDEIEQDGGVGFDRDVVAVGVVASNSTGENRNNNSSSSNKNKKSNKRKKCCIQ